ncbi:TPA: hypothetical protein GRI67_23830 [Vibrio parahaemolyticus]|nr:hypothetical protein [Vibrio parahaemolyticus]HAS6755985.1 hypothetical protein [Vibrio parahaemolyticus]HAS6775547.1 hypothetical protein [Vibrio parahaemolyticus]
MTTSGQLEMCRWFLGGLSAAMFAMLLFVVSIPTPSDDFIKMANEAALFFLLLCFPFNIVGLVASRQLQLVIAKESEIKRYSQLLMIYTCIGMVGFFISLVVLVFTKGMFFGSVLTGSIAGSLILWSFAKPKNT